MGSSALGIVTRVLESRWVCALIVAACFISTPLVLRFAGEAVKGHRNRVADWLPATYDETKELVWFREHFVADQFLVVSWEGCTLGDSAAEDDPRIARLTEAMKGLKVPGSETPAFQSVTNGRLVLEELKASASDIPEPAAIERLQGSLVGSDGRQTCIMGVLSDESVDRMREVIAWPTPAKLLQPAPPRTPLFEAIDAAGLTVDEVHLGGPPIDNISIDQEGQKTLASLATYSALLGVGLAWWSLRSVRMTALVFMCGLGSAAVTLSLVPLAGDRLDAILMSMPSLIYVLAVSGAIHYLNYYKAYAYEKGDHNPAYEALVHAWRPAFLCTITTSCGLLSLLASDITPIRRFGGYSAAGVVAALAVTFVFLPAALVVLPWKPRKSALEETAADSPFWRRFAGVIERHHLAILAGVVAITVGLSMGLPRITTSIDLLKLFSGDARLLADYQWFESKLGRLIPAEIVVRFPKRMQRERLSDSATPRSVAAAMTMLERLEVVDRVEASIRRRLGPEGKDLVGATMSAVTFAPELESQRGMSRRYAVSEALAEAKPELERAGYLRFDESTGEELWRITVRCAAFDSGERDEIVLRLREAVEPVLVGSLNGATALAQLARFEGESAAPPQVAVYAPEGIDDATRAATDLAQGRGVRVSVLEKKLDEVDQRMRDAVAQRDLVLVAPAGDGEVAELQKLGPPVSRVDAASADGEIAAVFTGVLPIVYKAQRELLNSLISSTWWSFATILPLMVYVCRGLWGGILVMLPNTLPILVVFGGMAWMGVAVDIGSMMAASIALGVAVDDTIHFLAWYREDVQRLGCRGEAIVEAYQRSATPTLQAGLVNGLGLSVFALSSFVPTQRFGMLMLAILGAGIVAELILLPSLLFSPLGRVFDPAPRGEGATAESPAMATSV